MNEVPRAGAHRPQFLLNVREPMNKSAVRPEPVEACPELGEGGERQAPEISWLRFVRGSTGLS